MFVHYSHTFAIKIVFVLFIFLTVLRNLRVLKIAHYFIEKCQVSLKYLMILYIEHFQKASFLKSIFFGGGGEWGDSFLKLKMIRLENLASFVIFPNVQIENDKYVELR